MPLLTKTVTVDTDRLRKFFYETLDEIGEDLLRLADQDEVTEWTRQDWESHMVVMPETGPNLPVEV